MRDLLREPHDGVYALVAYHLGWRDEHGAACEATSGKLLRPALVLTAARGFEPVPAAVDAACALEFLHAFSLVHDDIEDGDRERRHRPTLWALHGVPLAINAGDSLFALAHGTMIDAAALLPAARIADALRIFNDACLAMIEGQHADISYESTARVTRDDYLLMTSGKTGALIGASLALGAMFGGASDDDVEALRQAGVDLGTAFQAVDDALAVWGDPARTGKAVGNDAARGKKSLPVVMAAGRGCAPGDPRVRDDVQALARAHADRALERMRTTAIGEEAAVRLEALAAYILGREE
ncbi:MAG TPA: polyprenyl synthetase family protein [Dehalococcoidia bacterium]|nr:polyprenyl synthetase family protein [Dehalococcoidia bacterium]